MKKVLIIVGLVALVIFLAIAANNYASRQADKTEMERRRLLEQAQQTNGTGFISWISGIFGKGGGGGNVTEDQALEISKQIADYYETGNVTDKDKADVMAANLAASGWQYVGYNSVTEMT